ncbi:MAG: response regulator [Desulfosalsimonadaceae bacterium]
MTEKRKILVVDDEKYICENVSKILSKQNYEVVAAESGREALEKMAGDSFSLLLSDMVMPGMNGLELLKQVKDQWPLTRALIMTAYASTDTAVKAMQLGALDYISKPFTPDELRNIINLAVGDELKEAPKPSKAKEKIDIIDVDIPFDADEVAKYTGEDYVKNLSRSDMPVVEVKTPENYCETGEMACDIFAKLEKTCKAGRKNQVCPRKTAKTKQTAQKAQGPAVKTLIGVDMPFDYEEVAALTGAEYVHNLQAGEFAFMPYEQLKAGVPGQEAAGQSTAKARQTNKRTQQPDMPFDYEEVAALTGAEYARNVRFDGTAVPPYEELKEKMTGKEQEKAAETRPSLSEFPQQSGRENILVIDDEPHITNNIKKILGKKGHPVDQAVSREEALDKIRSGAYDLVLLDLKIPGVKGMELLQTVKAHLPEAGVIIITGYASIKTAKESARLGIVEYLHKPFTPDEIRSAAENALAAAA